MGKKKKKQKQNSALQTQDQQANNHVTEVMSQRFSRPLPPPVLLKQSDEVVPGSARTIIEKFEQQTNHRIEIEKSVVRTDDLKEILGGRWIYRSDDCNSWRHIYGDSGFTMVGR